MDTTVLVGLFASCTAIGTLSGVRHHHLSTLIRSKAEQYEKLRAKRDAHELRLQFCRDSNRLSQTEYDNKIKLEYERFEFQRGNIGKQVNKFLARNRWIACCIFTNVLGAVFLSLLCLPPITVTWTSLTPLYLGLFSLIVGLIIMVREFVISQDTLVLELKRVELHEFL